MVALSMADGYARLTNKPQCVIVHVDVGTQALGAAVHDASCGRAPVLIFAGLSPYTIEGEYRGSRTEYIHWIQDVPDQKQIIAQYCRYTGEIKRGKNVKVRMARSIVLKSRRLTAPSKWSTELCPSPRALRKVLCTSTARAKPWRRKSSHTA